MRLSIQQTAAVLAIVDLALGAAAALLQTDLVASTRDPVPLALLSAALLGLGLRRAQRRVVTAKR